MAPGTLQPLCFPVGLMVSPFRRGTLLLLALLVNGAAARSLRTTTYTCYPCPITSDDTDEVRVAAGGGLHLRPYSGSSGITLALRTRKSWSGHSRSAQELATHAFHCARLREGRAGGKAASKNPFRPDSE